MSFTLHITAGPAWTTDPDWASLRELISWAKEEYVGKTLGYLQPDKSYRDYDIDALYIMDDDSDSEDPVWSWYKD